VLLPEPLDVELPLPVVPALPELPVLSVLPVLPEEPRLPRRPVVEVDPEVLDEGDVESVELPEVLCEEFPYCELRLVCVPSVELGEDEGTVDPLGVEGDVEDDGGWALNVRTSAASQALARRIFEVSFIVGLLIVRA